VSEVTNNFHTLVSGAQPLHTIQHDVHIQHW
jgi:hypothetical protein